MIESISNYSLLPASNAKRTSVNTPYDAFNQKHIVPAGTKACSGRSFSTNIASLTGRVKLHWYKRSLNHKPFNASM